MSVVDYVDKIILWDTGSTDKTVGIIKELQKIKGDKIEFREVGSVSIEEFTKVRQQMLEETKSDWFMILDGDEVWWEGSIKKMIETIQKEGDYLESIISPHYNPIGDLYHYQEEAGGMYRIDNFQGHINIRAVNRKIKGLHFEKPHGQQGVYDGDGVLIQNRSKEKRKFLDAPYLHFTNMRRSFSAKEDKNVPKRKIKFKYELGIPFPESFKFPEVFYQPHPDIVPSVWDKMSKKYFLRASFETVLKKAKRKVLPSRSVGY